MTTNSEDFSSAIGDKREPHSDLAELFAGEHSSYWLGVDGLSDVLLASFGDEIRVRPRLVPPLSAVRASLGGRWGPGAT